MEPSDDIFTAVAPGGTRRTTHTQMNSPSGDMQVFRNLTTGLSGPDN
jgi:hypothetical protein